jgi:hypothetical protein
MKKQTLTLIVALSLLISTGSAFAQDIRVTSNVPFPFVVDKATLPAGHYSIQSIGLPGGKTLLLRGDQANAQYIVNTHGVEAAKSAQQTKLVFKRYGARYFLSEIWVAGNGSGHQLRTSPREKEMALDFQPQEVVVMASLH